MLSILSAALIYLVGSTAYMIMPHGQSCQHQIIVIADKSFENLAKSRCQETALKHQNCMHEEIKSRLTFWRRIFFFQISAHSIFKMCVIQKPNKVALWNKRHFEEKKKWRLYSMFKIFSTDICRINIKWGIYRVILRPSYIYDARFLKVKFEKKMPDIRSRIFRLHVCCLKKYISQNLKILFCFCCVVL